MPPKKQEVKKGPAYKPATPLKDIIPPTAKEPRESKPVKIPESFPDPPPKNSEDILPQLFEDWPSDETVKAHDFGINSEASFSDQQHERIRQYLNNELNSDQQTLSWKRLAQVWALKEGQNANSDSQNQNEEGVESKDRIESKEQLNKPKEEMAEGANGQANKKSLVVIETFLRDQTQEEMEKRKREEAEKAEKAAKDKKKGKKEQPKEEGPVKVSDVEMADVIIKKYMCPSGIWIGSQLQTVKVREIRDIYSEEAIWKKIYPQENEVPQITKSGKYWVKLFYMGKSIKVQVDDRIPVNQEERILFPTSEKDNEMWTLILTKALIKYFSMVCPKDAIIGSGMIIYALTGLITENIRLEGFKDWSRLEEFMSNLHYERKDIIINCYSESGVRKNQSNFIKSAKDVTTIYNLQNSTFRKRNKKKTTLIDQSLLEKAKGILDGEVAEEKIEQQYISNLVIPGCSYSIGDYFNTDEFNMVFSKEKSSKEQALRLEYNEMSKVSLTNKTRDQKLEHRKKKKEIKERLMAQEKKRMEQISKPPVNYHFLKLLGDINVHCEYSHKEILLAKKCVLNDLSQPPNYEIPSADSGSKQEMKTSISQIKFKEDSQVNIPLDDFEGIENTKELLDRPEQGVWIKDSDLLGIFDQIQIYYNPNIFQYKAIEEIPHQTANQFSYDENKEILVIEKAGNPYDEEKQAEQRQEGEQRRSQEKQEGKNSEASINFLFGFSFQESKWDTLCSPYCMLQKFDFDSYRTTSNLITLNSALSSTFLNLPNQNSIFKLYTLSKGRYAYWISSSSPYKMLSIADYLTEYEGYSSKSLPIQFPPLEGGCYQSLCRIKLKQEGEEKNTVILKLKNCPKDIEKYLNFKLVSIPESGVYTQEQTEGILTKDSEELLMAYEYTRAELKAGFTYYLLLEAYPTNNFPEGSFDLLLLSKQSGISIQPIEQIEPYKFVEKYQPNKYARILRERLFSSSSTNASLVFKVVEGEEGQPVATDKKASKKGGKEEPTFQIIEKPLEEKRLVHLKVLKNGNLVYYTKGYNEVIVSNIEIQSTNDDKNEYFLEASFDLREWPEASAQSEQNNRIYWSVQISGDDSIAFAKDTLKEDKEKETRKSWEQNQPGRAEKAKKSRQRYLLELKRQKGEELTEEQLQIVNAPRLTKKQLLEEEKKNEDKKGGKGAKKDDKKGAKDKKEEVVEQKKEERPLPKSEDNFMAEIKEFVKNLEDFKVENIPLNEGQSARIRSEEEQRSIKEGAEMAKENRTAQIIRNIEMRETMKIREKDKRDKLTILLEDTRSGFIQEWKKYIQWRIEDQEKDQVKQEKEKAVVEILKQEKPTISEADLTKMISEYRTVEGHNSKLADVADMLRKNIRVAGIEEKLNNLLAGWEVDEIKNTMKEIETDRVEGIEKEVLQKVNEMLQESEKNPGLVAEKQAELKKGGKKGAKK